MPRHGKPRHGAQRGRHANNADARGPRRRDASAGAGNETKARRKKPAAQRAAHGGAVRGPHGPNTHRRSHDAASPRSLQRQATRAHGSAGPQPSAAARVAPERLERALNDARPLRPGEWLWTTRPGSERDLIEELLFSGESFAPRRIGPALAASTAAPLVGDARLEVTFARQAFRVAALAQADTPDALAERIVAALPECLAGADRYGLHVFVPDSDSSNPLTARAQALQSAIERRCEALPLSAARIDDAELRRHAGMLIQVCLLAPDLAAIGGIHSGQALSLWPGGRARMRLAGDFPSRAARKLAEAFAWLGMSPSSGEQCVDLGAAPGGWSWLLLEQRARVIAVDPARMDAKLMQNPRLRHVQGSAFDYTPDEPVDWLFCDMVWRPPEVAAMLGRWGRRRLTRMLVANFKLAMKRKVEVVAQLRAGLQDSGYSAIRTRQLYHDRDEITLTAHVR